MNVNKVSVITLIYNNQDLLEGSLKSVYSQNLKNRIPIEYIVLDDGSDGFDPSKLEKWECLFHDLGIRLKVIENKANIGTVKSFNKALRLATGDLIVPLAADDRFYDSYVLEDIIEYFLNNSVLLCTGVRVPIRNDNELPSLPADNKKYLFSDRVRLLKELVYKGNIISGSSTYYHRDVFKKYGFFDENYRLIEDYPFYLRVLSSGGDIAFIDRRVIKYGTDGITKKKKQSPFLICDNERVVKYSREVVKMTSWEKRCFYYQRELSNSLKLNLRNVARYPDQFFIYVMRKIHSYFKVLGINLRMRVWFEKD